MSTVGYSSCTKIRDTTWKFAYPGVRVSGVWKPGYVFLRRSDIWLGIPYTIQNYSVPSVTLTGYTRTILPPVTVTCSTVYSTHKAWYAGDTSDNCWVTTATDTVMELIYQTEEPLFNITATLQNRDNSSPNGPQNGTFYGSNNGTDWTAIGSFTNRANTPNMTEGYACDNDKTAYKWFKFKCTAKYGSYLWIKRFYLTGDLWVNPHPALPDLPQIGMTSANYNQYVVTSSGYYGSGLYDYLAFNKSTEFWGSNTSAPRWIMIQTPYDFLHDFSVKIKNAASSSAYGMTEGSIEGSADGTNFYTLATITGRDGATAGYESTHACDLPPAGTWGSKYIRINVTAIQGGNSWCKIAEITIINAKNYDFRL